VRPSAPAIAVAATREELSAEQCRRAGDVGLVMTMGALHTGHESLIAAARGQHATVVVSVFVNPTQFGAEEDFDGYPRRLADDVARCACAGADVVFAPTASEVYRGNPQVTVDPGPLGEELEGAARPGHFAGVLTVVHKLLHIVPGVRAAYFGEKDYQQLTLVRRMCHDLDLAPQIVGCPTVRDPDGLALSSRNAYLSPDERRRALALPRALRAGAAHREATDVLGAARQALDGIDVDYLELRSPDLSPPPAAGPARLLAAVRIGRTRLLDNVAVDVTRKEF